MEMLLHGGRTLHDALASLFTRIIQTGVFPLEWKELVFTMLPKTDDPLDPGN